MARPKKLYQPPLPEGNTSKTTFSGTFSEWKFYSLILIPLLFVPNGPIHNKGSIGTRNGFASNRRQTISRDNANPVGWRIYAAQGGDELN